MYATRASRRRCRRRRGSPILLPSRGAPSSVAPGRPHGFWLRSFALRRFPTGLRPPGRNPRQVRAGGLSWRNPRLIVASMIPRSAGCPAGGSIADPPNRPGIAPRLRPPPAMGRSPRHRPGGGWVSRDRTTPVPGAAPAPPNASTGLCRLRRLPGAGAYRATAMAIPTPTCAGTPTAGSAPPTARGVTTSHRAMPPETATAPTSAPSGTGSDRGTAHPAAGTCSPIPSARDRPGASAPTGVVEPMTGHAPMTSRTHRPGQRAGPAGRSSQGTARTMGSAVRGPSEPGWSRREPVGRAGGCSPSPACCSWRSP